MSLSGGPLRFSLSKLSLLALFVLFCGLPVFAQQPRISAPHKPVKPKLTERLPWGKPIANQSALGGLWISGPNWKTSLYITNGLKTDSLTVTPSVYLANGVRYTFDPVTIEPSATAIVDINQELAKQGIASYASLSGYAQIEYQWPWAPVCASVRNVDLVHDLIFLYGLQPGDAASIRGHASSGNEPQILEGMWWKQERNVTGFVALSNISGKPIDANLEVTDAANNTIGNHGVTVSPHGTKIVELTELSSTTDAVGGVLLTHNGVEFGLVVSGGLVDEATGYSAHMYIAPSLSGGASLPTILNTSSSNLQLGQPTGFAALGLMTGAADPMMNFPSGTIFTPYTVVRNISDQPASVTATLWWMAGAAAKSAPGPQFQIAPHQTLNLNLPNLLALAGLKNFSGNVNVVLDTTAVPGGLLTSSGSVDQRNNYVFEVIPSGILESASKSLSYWSTGNGDDTMVTFWNPADEAQDFVFTLFFTGGHYLHPIHLEPRATYTFNVSEITHTGIPDAEGNLVPAGVYEGSAQLSGSQGEQEHILVNMDAGTYNVRKAICAIYCHGCDGVTNTSMIASPFAVAVNGQSQQTFYEIWNTGSQYNDTNYSNWSSTKTNIATVQTGLIHGVSPGSVDVAAVYYFNEPLYTSYWCTQSQWSCPLYLTTPSGGASGSAVAIPINFRQASVIQLTDGGLQFIYYWDSSSGNTNDLATCQIGEIVNYPGTASPYKWTQPPYTQPTNPVTTNPFIANVSATNWLVPPDSHVGTVDQNIHPAFQKPYTYNNFTASQQFRFQCTNYNNGNWIYLTSSGISITRDVTQNSNGSWKYTIMKSGASNTVNPMP